MKDEASTGGWMVVLLCAMVVVACIDYVTVVGWDCCWL